MEIAGLSFVGLGAQAPSPEWGAMMNDGRTYIQEAPWIVAFPCIFLIVIILLFTKFGFSQIECIGFPIFTNLPTLS